MQKLVWNYRYAEGKRNGYNGSRYADRQIVNSTKPSTYLENYSMKEPSWIPWRGITLLCVIGGSLYGLLYLEVFDPIFRFFIETF